MPNCPVSVSGGFSSTPVKSNRTTELTAADSTGDEDTFSLLSPIYHDSFDSDGEELNSSPIRLQGPGSPDRCELPKSSLEPRAAQPSAAQPPAAQPPAAQPSAAQPPAASLSAWETWVLSKAKEERLKLEQKAEEDRILKEKEEQQEEERERKRMVMEEKIQEWLKVKRKHKMQEQLVKHRAEEEKMQKEMEKQREVEQKAQQKYNVWLQKKNKEKLEKEKKEKEIAALKGAQEEERRRRAEEKFKEWLAKANEKSRVSPESPHRQTSPYDRLIPAPSFYNPIPWKPIHSPPENPQKKMPVQRNAQQGHRGALRRSNAGSTPRLLQRT